MSRYNSKIGTRRKICTVGDKEMPFNCIISGFIRFATEEI